MENRPDGRQKNVTGAGKDIRTSGSGLGTGPVGKKDGYAARPRPGEGSGGTSYSASGRREGASSSGGVPGARSVGGGKGIIAIIIALVAALVGGGAGLSSLFGGSGNTDVGTSYDQSSFYETMLSSGASSSSHSSILSSVLGAFSGGSSLFTSESVSGDWLKKSNSGVLKTDVALGARAKYTKINGRGSDTVTIMVYMCGTDLESKSGMASSDINEMLKATLSDRVNLLIYTGGCRAWKGHGISNTNNQIYKIEGGRLVKLVDNDGNASLTKPSTLTSFIKYASSNYPANRNFLIMWDHGGGSISGYGYDEKNASAGSMGLSGIDRALTDAKVKFDAIGFDACLMATYENALMLDAHADYLIASEETEPGIGWYYTNWLTALSKNTSLSTLEIGKMIADDFVADCASRCPGQKATLSVVDVAELSATTPSTFKQFALETEALCCTDDYQKVADARAEARSFAVSSKKDMVDLAHLGYNIGTSDAEKMADSVVGAVKYNKTSSNMPNSYGISIYFPYQKTSGVDNAVKTYEAIGLDENYTRVIRSFASLEVAGQSAASSSGSVSDIIGSLFGGSSGISSLFGRGLNLDETTVAKYVSDNRFDRSALVWRQSGSDRVISLSEEQWSLVHDVALNVMYDNGSGYIDLGLDCVFELNGRGELIGSYDGTWLAIDSQPIAYYNEDITTSKGKTVITGYVPILLNGERAEMILVFDDEDPYGRIAGARYVYGGKTDTVAKALTDFTEGDIIEFIADCYDDDLNYVDTYVIADMEYTGNHKISNVYIDRSRAVAAYCFTDIYGGEYWTEVIPG